MTLRRIALAATAGGALALPPTPGVAQLPRELPEIRALSATPLEQADSLFLAFEPATALAVLEAHIRHRPDDYEARWRATRAGLVLGVLEDDDEATMAFLERAEGHGEVAVELEPEGVDGLYWTGAVLGRQALLHGPRSSTRLVERVWDLAHRLLEIEPDHAGGHNILGKLNQEVMSLSGFERFLGRLLFRAEPLKEATWERAVHHHEAAVASDPEVVLFHFDLATTYAALERFDEARDHLRAALDVTPTYPVDPHFQRLARDRLEELPAQEGSGG